MGIHQTYAVFGLGRYGVAVAKELTAGGAEVLAVDRNQDIIDSAIADIPLCKCADVTDAEVIKQLGISNIDVVIIAMASNLEASVMATMLCKECGVPTVIVKCGSEMHQKILSRLGADQVVFPERESGSRLAKNFLSAGFVDMIDLSKDVSMIELDVKPAWTGKTLADLRLRKKYSINVVAIRQDDQIITSVDPEKPLRKDMKLIVIANVSRVSKLR